MIAAPTSSHLGMVHQGDAVNPNRGTSDATHATAGAGESAVTSDAARREGLPGKASASVKSMSSGTARAAGKNSDTESAAALFPNLTVLRDTPREPAMQLALDQACAEAMAAGRMGPLIRLWQWDRAAVVIGRFQSVGNEVNLDQARAEHVTVVRRITGGGAMFAEPESVITYSLIAPLDWVTGLSIGDSYRRCDQWVLDALRPLGIEARYQPINDIASPLGKIGGAAQRRFPAPADGTGHGGGPGAVLHHTMLSYDMDAAKMLRVLNVSKEKMSDKAVKSAAKRVDPLRSQTGLTRAEVLDRMIATLTDPEGPYRARYAGPERADDVIGRDVLDRAADLARIRFATPEWTALIP
ncbi:lipoate--protein ligase family protein [Bifidobacterium avesanii]|uniref:Lipoate--protein ligase family protein n=2 Tax=Bifidobacterium avesanii TaxID=1798157 RepID=A0A7K3THJ6_9BIFI|nr:lipoate--protein ligase family protein [Bifidobacterium avesanii]